MSKKRTFAGVAAIVAILATGPIVNEVCQPCTFMVGNHRVTLGTAEPNSIGIHKCPPGVIATVPTEAPLAPEGMPQPPSTPSGLCLKGK